MSAVDFEAPPVAEVAVGVQFPPVSALGGMRSGVLWDDWSSSYPNVQEQPWLPRWPDLEQQGPWFQFGPGPAGSRTWFLDTTLDHVLQVQNDRLIANWRKVSGEPYPRFPDIAARFRRAWSDVTRFALASGPVEIEVDQVEVSYINNVDASPRQVLRGWDSLLDGEEWSRSSANFVRRIDCEGATDARFMVALDGSHGDGGITSLTLTVKAVPANARDPFPAIDGAHDVIVSRFRSMTTEPMHQVWRVK